MLWNKKKQAKQYMQWNNYKEKIEFLNDFYFEQAQLKAKL